MGSKVERWKREGNAHHVRNTWIHYTCVRLPPNTRDDVHTYLYYLINACTVLMREMNGENMKVEDVLHQKNKTKK